MDPNHPAQAQQIVAPLMKRRQASGPVGKALLMQRLVKRLRDVHRLWGQARPSFWAMPMR
jgi:hypothetical protein